MYLTHLWFGLLSSLVVFTLCLTGCLYAFKTQITELYNRDLVFVEKIENTKQLPDELIKNLESEKKKITAILLPDKSKRSWVISYTNQSGDLKTSFYDPYQKKELGVSDQSLDRFFEIVLDIHRTLLMGEVGRQILGVGVLMFLYLMFSGFILWLPKKLKYLKQNLTIKLNAKFKRLNYDLHNVFGFYTMIFLAFISITGLYITYPWVKNALIVSLGGESLSQINSEQNKENDDAFASLMNDMLDRQKEKSEIDQEKQVSINELISTTEKFFPKPGIISINYPNSENPRYTVTKIDTDNFLGALLPNELTFDKKGELKTKDIFSDKPLNKQFTSLSKPLHTGEIMGLPSIIFYFIITLIGCLLPVTGFVIYYHRLVKTKV